MICYFAEQHDSFFDININYFIVYLFLYVGPTATEELRKKGFSCPVVGLTGNILPADKKLFLESGAIAVLTKPLSFQDLEDIFDRIRNDS
jgi:CheY-like chemotaxis protein